MVKLQKLTLAQWNSQSGKKEKIFLASSLPKTLERSVGAHFTQGTVSLAGGCSWV